MQYHLSGTVLIDALWSLVSQLGTTLSQIMVSRYLRGRDPVVGADLDIVVDSRLAQLLSGCLGPS